jgi:hypothetical protein
VPVALAACALLPLVARGDDRLWWERVGEGDWRRPDYALPLGPDACPRVRIERALLEATIEAGIDALVAVLDQPRLTAVYTHLLAGSPVLLPGLEQPLPPAALAALLLPLPAALAARYSLAAWVPATLCDPQDLGQNWDLSCTRQTGVTLPAPPAFADRGAALAQALRARDPGLINGERAGPPGIPSRPAPDPAPRDRSGAPVAAESPPGAIGEQAGDAARIHPNPRLHLGPAAAATRPGLRYLYAFADRVNLRRLDLSQLAQDLDLPGVYPLLASGEDPAGHPLIGWIGTLEQQCPGGVDPADWAFKVDQLRAAALFLLPHPRTLDLVGLPRDPRVPALLAALAADPSAVGGHLAAHGEPGLRRLLAHSLACPGASVAADIQAWMQQWLDAVGEGELGCALADLL